ncbi:hypothetical protein [Streptomyces luteireticuli]|uniref:hypothetical protein n=1 Tax=Streptomyces luteireticuli TaxID=173858 RepID=UPI0035576460
MRHDYKDYAFGTLSSLSILSLGKLFFDHLSLPTATWPVTFIEVALCAWFLGWRSRRRALRAATHPTCARTADVRWLVEVYDAGEWGPATLPHTDEEEAQRFLTASQERHPDLRYRLVRQRTEYLVIHDTVTRPTTTA